MPVLCRGEWAGEEVPQETVQALHVGLKHRLSEAKLISALILEQNQC